MEETDWERQKKGERQGGKRKEEVSMGEREEKGNTKTK